MTPEAHTHRRTPLAALVALAAALAGLTIFLAAGPATAQDGSFPPRFWDRCDSSAPAGEQCGAQIRGVAANPSNGRVYLADHSRNRIVEYSAWGEFLRTWGWDVVASGPNDTAADEFEVCVPADGDVCKPGTAGSGVGQLATAQSVAVDSAGSIYVADRSNRRVQKFAVSNAGVEFAWMAGGGVNQGPSNPGNLCTAAHLAAGDTCGAGSEGSDPGEFGFMPHGNYIATGPADQIYVGDDERIQRFNTNGVYQSEIAVPGEVVRALAVDPDGDLYASFLQGTLPMNPSKPNVRKLSPTGADLGTLTVENPRALATGPDGNVYVADDTHSVSAIPTRQMKIHVFSPSGSLLETFSDPVDQNLSPDGLSATFGIAANPVTPDGDTAIYVANLPSGPGTRTFLRAYSPTPDPDLVGPPPLRAPDVNEFASEVGIADATLGAEINPHFWADATYYAEYGSEGPCDSNPCQQVRFPGVPLEAGVTDTPKAVGVPIGGLEPATTYHFRFVASSSGGGPTFGQGAAFTTFPPNPAPRTDCPNQAHRTGPSARLSDCRAYELVSPVEKNGGDVFSPPFDALVSRGFQASRDGERLAFRSRTAFADAPGAPYLNAYLASRDQDAGWSTRSLDAPRDEFVEGDTLRRLRSDFLTFSEDLSQGWMLTLFDPPLDPAAVSGYRNLYRRDDLADSHTALTTVTPPTATPDGLDTVFDPRFAGSSADGTHAVYSANDRLLAGASSATTGQGRPIRQLYEHRDGAPLRLVSRLPNGSASDEPSTAGGGTSYLSGAVSEDGARIYWTTGDVFEELDVPLGSCLCGTGRGRVYLRLDGAETVAVSETVSGADAQFWAAARDGSAALFSFVSGPNSGELYRFELATQTSELVATGVRGVIGASRDLERAYLVSEEVLDPGPNSEGEVAVGGEGNVYHYERGAGFAFVATVPGIRLFTQFLTERLSQVSPDGRHLAFASTRSLTGYDNAEREAGEPTSQVFRHSAASGELNCVSCNPTGARPAGRRNEALHDWWDAARIRGWEGLPFRQPRSLSDDGQRLYFDSLDALLPHDTNGRADVYEWRAPGAGECTTDHPHYFPQNGGCLALISTGKSAGDSSFADATPDGSTVFINTEQSLLPHDPGLFDAYAARIGGGFAQPVAPVPCEGDACQPPPEVPEDQTPASADFEGSGNERPASDCATLQRGAQRAAKRSRSQRQRAKRLRQRAKRQARRGNARKAKRARQRAKRVGRGARSQRQRAKRLRGEARACRQERTTEGSGR